MKKLLVGALLLASLGAVLSGCSYGGIAVAGDKVVITRNDNAIFGALRKVYVCKVTDAGVTGCTTKDAP